MKNKLDAELAELEREYYRIVQRDDNKYYHPKANKNGSQNEVVGAQVVTTTKLGI